MNLRRLFLFISDTNVMRIHTNATNKEMYFIRIIRMSFVDWHRLTKYLDKLNNSYKKELQWQPNFF